MKIREGWALLIIFFILLIAPIIVIIGEVSDDHSYDSIHKYPRSKSAAPIRFHLIGDFGDLQSTDPINNTEPVKLVSDIMREQSLQRPISFIISAGDNSYPHSYANFDQTIYKLMYDTFDVDGLKGKPWYLVLGNHDCVVTPDYELHSNKLYPMWNMPSSYYNFSIPIDTGSVGFSFLDGCILLGDDQKEISKQYSWLRQVLSDQANDSSIVWKVVTVHMPLWSSGQYHGDNEPLKISLYPLLFEYGVDLVLSGHEHVMSHFASRIIDGKPQPYVPLPDLNYSCDNNEYVPYNRASDWFKGEAIHEVVQGAGGRELYEFCPSKTTEMADLLYGYSSYGFTEIYIDHSVITIDYFNLTVPEPVFTIRILNI